MVAVTDAATTSPATPLRHSVVSTSMVPLTGWPPSSRLSTSRHGCTASNTEPSTAASTGAEGEPKLNVVATIVVTNRRARIPLTVRAPHRVAHKHRRLVAYGPTICSGHGCVMTAVMHPTPAAYKQHPARAARRFFNCPPDAQASTVRIDVSHLGDRTAWAWHDDTAHRFQVGVVEAEKTDPARAELAAVG